MNQESGIRNEGDRKTTGRNSLFMIHNSRGEGFTLIELMVVISIVTFLTTILVGYSRQSGRQLLLSSTEAKILSLVSRAKFLSIETFFRELGGSGSSRKICAYGVHVDGDEIFIFQDRVPDPPGDCSAATDKYESGAIDARLSGDLDSVKIDSNLMTLDGTLKDIVYIPPDPDVVINNSSTGDATIEVSLKDGSGDFVITVNNAGQVRAN